MYLNRQQYYEELAKLKSKLDRVNQLNKPIVIIDISSYSKKLEEIEIKLGEKPDFDEARSFESDSMQQDFVAFAYTPAIEEINKLNKQFEKEVEPYYIIKWRATEIQQNIEKRKNEESNINNIQENAKEILKTIKDKNLIPGDLIENNERRQKIISEAYFMIYMTILYEATFDRHDILNLVTKESNEVIKESINYFITKGAAQASKQSSEFKNYYSQYSQNKYTKRGFGDNFFETDFIEKLSKEIIGKKNEEYINKRNQELKKIIAAMEEIKKKQQSPVLIQLRKELANAKQKKAALSLVTLPLEGKKYLILTPIILTLACGSLGLMKSLPITEYRTITETYNVDTEETDIISSEFCEYETGYTTAIVDAGPWKNNPNGTGFIRTVKVYTYTPPEDIEENRRITREDLFNELTKPKYKYMDAKQELSPSDSMENNTITITQTYQDKNDTRRSTKYLLPGATIGLLAGIFIDLILNRNEYSIRNNLRRKRNRLESLKEIIDVLQCDLQQKENVDKEIQDLKSAVDIFAEKYGLEYAKTDLDEISKFIKEQEGHKEEIGFMKRLKRK